jgi:cystathionine beta-synthase
MGYSSGAAMQAVFKIKRQLGPEDVVVVLFPDHGSRYLGKIYNDEWMRQQGFIRQAEPMSPYSHTIRKIYRMYRMKYKKYIRQTRQTLHI